MSIVLGPEAEEDLVRIARAADRRLKPLATRRKPSLSSDPELAFIQPDRAGLPALDRYATLQMPDGSRKIVAATDATRGCKHRCRHCPIVPVYDGQFRVVPVDVVMADIRAQVEQGASTSSFGDPDFFNGPTHARRIVEALHREFPALTYDAIIKVEHLLEHRKLLPVLVETGCLFVTSAVESVDDDVLAKLEKGHTRADFIAAVGECRSAGAHARRRPSSRSRRGRSIDGYIDLLNIVDDLDLAAHVAPVQWGIRLLVTWGSRLLELDEIRARVGPFDAKTLTYPWQHRDPRVDALQRQVMALAAATTKSREAVFETARKLAHAARGQGKPSRSIELVLPSRSAIPYMNEPWYC